MNKKAIVIGAGQIGRGFLGERLFVSGYDVVFVDANESLVANINSQESYRVILLGEEDREYHIGPVRAVCSKDPAVAKEFETATVVVTAVGPKILPIIAPMIAEGIRLRKQAEIFEPLTVIACENMSSGTTVLREHIDPLLDDAVKAYCEEYVGFPDAEVSRIVVPIQDPNLLTVRVERYMEWIIDRTKVKGDLTDVEGLELSDHVEAYVQRKIFTLTGHAMLGAMGYQKGYSWIWQAVYDPDIFESVYGALQECGWAWSKRYGLPVESFMKYAARMLIRFADQRIQDPCARPCREPMRKLGSTERFIAPALAVMSYGGTPVHIASGIRAMLCFDAAADPEAVTLQRRLKETDVRAVLADLSGLDQGHPLFDLVC